METAKSFFAGWAGGIGMTLVGHPLDTVKVLMQSRTFTIGEAVKFQMAQHGKFGLYKGAGAVCAGTGPVFALYFAAYDGASAAVRSFNKMAKTDALSKPQIAFCGACTGVAGSLILGPAELIKVKMQLNALHGLDSNLKPVLKEITKEGVAKGFSRGLGATMMRDVPASTAWFASYEIAKDKLAADPSAPSTPVALVSGGIAGICNWLVCMPMDTVKTKIQASPTAISWPAAARGIMAEGGVPAFYRGIFPVLLRAFPANAACFACKEAAMNFFNMVSPPKTKK